MPQTAIIILLKEKLELLNFEKRFMGATILKLKKNNQPLTEKQKSLLEKLKNAPIMTDEQYQEYKKINKWMRKWKI